MSFINSHQDVLGFDVSMNDVTLGVKVMKSLKDLSGDTPDIFIGNPFVVGPDDQFQEVVSQDFEDHTDMSSIDSSHPKVIQELDYLLSKRIIRITVCHRFE